MKRIRVSHQFEKDDGTRGTRSTYEDGESLPRRIFIRMSNYLKGDEGNTVVIPGVNAYNCGEYEEALKLFHKAVVLHQELSPELQPHIDACKRVMNTLKDNRDHEYEEKWSEWERKPRLFRFFSKPPIYQIRCKYCGHYTPYLDPLDGLAYLGTNNCARCGRGYPAPDFAWDGLDGQAYIYYRGSVKEDVFYTEFEQRYQVLTARDHFMKKEV